MTNFFTTRRGAILLVVVAVALISVQAADWDASTRTQTTATQPVVDYVYPRLNQNCLNRDGWVWTGQTCQRCTKYACLKCSDENTCAPECPAGWGLYTDPLQPAIKYCKRCGTGDYPSAGIKTCRFQTISTNPTTTANAYAFQATECRSGYTLFGGVCYGIQWCDNSYTQYGRCSRCVKGYYLDTEGYCSKCMS